MRVGTGVDDDDRALKIPSTSIPEFAPCFGHIVPKHTDQLPDKTVVVFHV